MGLCGFHKVRKGKREINERRIFFTGSCNWLLCGFAPSFFFFFFFDVTWECVVFVFDRNCG